MHFFRPKKIGNLEQTIIYKSSYTVCPKFANTMDAGHLGVSGCIHDYVQNYPPCALFRNANAMLFWSPLNPEQIIAYTKMMNHYNRGRLSFDSDFVFAPFQQYNVRTQHNIYHFTIVSHKIFLYSSDGMYHQVRQFSRHTDQVETCKLPQIISLEYFESSDVRYSRPRSGPQNSVDGLQINI